MAEALRRPVRLPAGQRLHAPIIELDARVQIAHADPLILAVGAPVSLLEESARDSVGWNPRRTQESGVRHAGLHAAHQAYALPQAIRRLPDRGEDLGA